MKDVWDQAMRRELAASQTAAALVARRKADPWAKRIDTMARNAQQNKYGRSREPLPRVVARDWDEALRRMVSSGHAKVAMTKHMKNGWNRWFANAAKMNNRRFANA